MYSITSYRCTTVIHNFKGYTPFILIKYWLYSLCYTIYPISYKGYFIHDSLWLLISPILHLHPSLSPLVTTSFSLYMCSLSIYLFPFCYIQQFIILDSTYKCYHTVLSVCLISLSIISSSPSMLLEMAKCHSFLWLNNIPFHIFIHSYVDGHLSCFIFWPL